MKPWQLIAAIALCALLVAALVFVLVRSGQETPQDKAPTRPLSTIQMNEVVRITVRGADGSVTRLERDALNEWYLVAPISARAEQQMVTLLLADLLAVESSNPAPADKIDLAYAGLVTPTGTIVLGLRSGAEQTLEVGLTEPRYMAYFVRLGDSVYLFPWDLVERAMRWLTVMPAPAAPTPTSGMGAGVLADVPHP